MTITLDLKFILFIVWVVLTLISIIINICIFCALRKNAKGTMASAIKNGVETASDILAKLNINGLGDAIELIKDIIALPEGGKENDENRKT